jgi:hypothetical protein
MCDYSLHAVASRAAELGETLVSTSFRGSSTAGFANPKEKQVAVCLLPGTELAFENNVKYRGRWFRSHTIPFSVAQFCKIAPEKLSQHHDALVFPDGRTLLLDTLVAGQRLRVLQLPLSAKELARHAAKQPKASEKDVARI